METFEQELEKLINRWSIENESNTPDFILAQYVRSCLHAFAMAAQQREARPGREGRATEIAIPEDVPA